MTKSRGRLAFVSMHTSPVADPGAGDAGGMNVVVRALADAVADLGFEIDLLTRRSDPDSPDATRLSERVTLRQLKAGPASALPKSQIDAHIDEFREAMQSLCPYDLVHSHHWMSGVAALPLAHACGVKHLQSFHSVAAHPFSPLREGEPPESPARLAGEVLVAQESDLVIAVSHAEAATVIGRCGADPQRVAIVKPGVDSALFHPKDLDECWVPADGVRGGYVLFAARLQPLKGADLAIRALAEVPVELRRTLVIAGDVSADFADYGRELHNLVSRLGLDNDVVFIGPQSRPDQARLIRNAAVVLVPSHSETFGLIALEASASGVPVLASAAGGLTEAVVNGSTGLLTADRDPKVWGDLLTTLLVDQEFATGLGQMGRERALSLSWGSVAEQLVAHYVRLNPALA